MQTLIYMFLGFSVWTFGPSMVRVKGQEQFWHRKMFDSNPDVHPQDCSSTHIPTGTMQSIPGDSLVV